MNDLPGLTAFVAPGVQDASDAPHALDTTQAPHAPDVLETPAVDPAEGEVRPVRCASRPFDGSSSEQPAGLGVPGFTYLVGAGPGEVDLLTVRAVRVLGLADVILHDALVGPEILELAPPDAELIDVGKRAGNSSSQDIICALMIEFARQGKTVVRLKGGDPYVFGRGGEEIEALRQAGLNYSVVPGISSSIAAPAAAGIPVTHRNVSAAYTVVTGHRTEGADPVDWSALAKVGGTIVLLMAVGRRGEIARALITGGLPGNTPVAAITNGSRHDQTDIRTTLAELNATPVEAPATIVIGAVAAMDLRDQMQIVWSNV